MKAILIALTLLSLPVAAPVQASQTPEVAPGQSLAGTVERRSHHCNTPAQSLSPRCRGI